MIYSVFDRLSKDPEMDIEDSKHILAWITFAQRDLKFGEIDIILRLESKTTNWLLWDHLRDKFSSILRFRYPRGSDPHPVELAAHPGGDIIETVQQHQSDIKGDGDLPQPSSSLEDIVTDEDEDINLGDDSEDDAKSSVDDGGDASSRELQSDNSTENESPQIGESFSGDMDEADAYYGWNIRQTKIDFAHHRFREYLKIEGARGTRQMNDLPINFDMDKVQIQLTFDCFKMLRLGVRNGTFNGLMGLGAQLAQL